MTRATIQKPQWPPNYTELFMERQARFLQIKQDPMLQLGSLAYYKDNPIDFINDWCITYDPRNAFLGLPTLMPFYLFPKQKDLVQFLHECIKDQESGLIEKCRDMGATWVAVGVSVWLWALHDGSAVGWGSRKEQLVDKIGDPDSIFEKIRMVIQNLPFWFLPVKFDFYKHSSFMKISNPENRATITGEAGDNIGRGGRKLIYFKDESAHYERPEKIEAALGDTTNVQIDISSVHGSGNVFHRRKLSGEVWEPTQIGRPKRGTTRVFIMDWRDHPAKNQAWYDARRAKAEREGLLHVFSQEVDRDYSAAIEGILIPAVWVRAAIDAHIKLGIEIEGAKRMGFDPFDEGGDTHAAVAHHGPLCYFVDKWSEGDVGQATSKVLSLCKEKKIRFMNFDGVGVGAGAKSEYNRQKDNGHIPNWLFVNSFISQARVQKPNEHIIVDDPESPMNKDFYLNLKAQAYWNVRLSFERTYKAVYQKEVYDPAELIFLDSTMPLLEELVTSLSQPTYVNQQGSGKLMVNKTPKGTKSPNLADAFVMGKTEIIVFNPSDCVVICCPGGSKIEERVAV